MWSEHYGGMDELQDQAVHLNDILFARRLCHENICLFMPMNFISIWEETFSHHPPSLGTEGDLFCQKYPKLPCADVLTLPTSALPW